MRGLTPLIGRESESRLLFERWQQAQAGYGQVILLSGEAGIGKSRLVQALKDHVGHDTHMRVECRSSPYFTHSALYPLTNMLHRLLWGQPEMAREKRLERLEQHLSQCRLRLEQTVPLFATLLSLSVPEDRYPPLHLSPQRQRQNTLEAIIAILLAWAERQPVLFILEDLHWTDPSTLEVLQGLIEQSSTASILTLLTCRPTFEPTWRPQSSLTEITVDRLSDTDVEQLVARLTDDKALPSEVMQQVIEKTDGVPLFVEELVKAILESGDLRAAQDRYELVTSQSALLVPTTLQDSLMSRLDRLGTAKGIAQWGATIGREFSYALLEAVSQVEAVTLQRELDRLVEAELVYQHGLPPQSAYLFKHALIQETAYQSLLKATRQHYHRQIAEVVGERFPVLAEAQPELVAHHYTEAGLIEQAIPLWQQAGRHAVERSAYAEGAGHFRDGLKLLQVLPETSERLHAELMLHLSLGGALIAVKGYAAPEVEQTYTRARELCQQIGETPRLLQVLLGLHACYFVSGALRMACEVGEQSVTLARQSGDPARLMQAHYAHGAALLFRGEVNRAQEHLDQGIVLHRPQYHQARALQDPGVTCLAYAGGALWLRSYVDQTLQRSEEAVALARSFSHAFSLAHALYWAALLHLCRREWQAARDRVDASLALATEHQLPFWLAMCMMLRGRTQIELDDVEAGMSQVSKGITLFQSTGSVSGQTGYLSWLAEAQSRAGQVEVGLETLRSALRAAHQTGEHLYIAELYRLQGEFLLQGESRDHPTGEQGAAESCFHQALVLSRDQQTKSWELRAATSLARLWQSQDKHQDAYDLLAPVYGWFTEGFDTADLQDAKAILDKLRT